MHSFCWRMIFCENRFPFFGIMRKAGPVAPSGFALNNSVGRPGTWPGLDSRSAVSDRRMNPRPRRGNCRATAVCGFPDLSRIVGKNSPGTATLRGTSEAKKPLSALEIGVDHLGHLIDRQGTRVRCPIDEESWR